MKTNTAQPHFQTQQLTPRNYDLFPPPHTNPHNYPQQVSSNAITKNRTQNRTQTQFQTVNPQRQRTVRIPPYTPAQSSLATNPLRVLTMNTRHTSPPSTSITSITLSRQLSRIPTNRLTNGLTITKTHKTQQSLYPSLQNTKMKTSNIIQFSRSNFMVILRIHYKSFIFKYHVFLRLPYELTLILLPLQLKQSQVPITHSTLQLSTIKQCIHLQYL